MKTEGRTTVKTDKSPTRRRSAERVLEGLGVSPGIGIGPAHLRESGEVRVVEYHVPAAHAAAEVARFEGALDKARRQLTRLQAKAADFHGASAEELGYLLDAHMQMLRSSRLREGVKNRIATCRLNAEAAVMAEIDEIGAAFAEMDDPYLRSRIDEIREVGFRILRTLTEKSYAGFTQLPANSVLIAEEITPADTALMDPKRVAGFASVLGGAEGHTAIMARSLGLPAVLGVSGLLEGVDPDATVIIDGSRGLVIVNPTKRRLESYQRRRTQMAKEFRALAKLRDLPAVTKDDIHLTLQANLELPGEVPQAIAAGAEGIGLLRTEFMFMNRDDLPDEEEQTATLTEIVRGMGGKPVTVRTLDVGGEKLASSLGGHLGNAVNPALGLRAIRLSLKVPELLEAQLAATLRAGAEGPVRILLPMVASVEEVRAVRKILERVAARLRRAKVKIADPLPPLGAMIEVPGAALSADSLAREADFFAIGTNDLIMYTLAIDRGEEQVAHLYDPLHPAVMRLIHFSIDAALRYHKPVSVCGEMAGDPRFTALFVGLGVRDLSMSPKALPRIKDRVRKMHGGAATEFVVSTMTQADRGMIVRLLDAFNRAD